MLPLRDPGKNPSCTSSSSQWLQAVLGVPWLVSVSLQSLPHLHLAGFPLCVSASHIAFLKGHPNLDFLVAQTVKNPPAMQETWVQSLGWEDPLEEGMATNSSILVWRIPMDRGAWWATVHGVVESLRQDWMAKNSTAHHLSKVYSPKHKATWRQI